MSKLQTLPAPIKSRLDELVATLTKTLGDKLVGIIAHGSAVRGGYREGSSDVDLVCVLADDSVATLSSIGRALELARYSARIETMLLTQAEIARSADCFPLLYGDIKRESATLHGTNPFAELAISDAHKRLRIEQELREIRIRLRRVATDLGGTSGFGGAVERKLKQARAPLWALLALRGEQVADGFEPVLRAAAKAYSLDAAPLLHAHEDAKAAYAALATLLDAALHDVDTREVG